MLAQWQPPSSVAENVGVSVSEDRLTVEFKSGKGIARGLQALPSVGVTKWRLEVLELCCSASHEDDQAVVGICRDMYDIDRFQDGGSTPAVEAGSWLMTYSRKHGCTLWAEEEALPLEHPRDVAKNSIIDFIFNADARTLRLMIDGIEISPFFESIPPGILYPMVAYVSVRSLQVDAKRKLSDCSFPQTKYARKVWRDRKFCDVSIICEGGSIPCHRAILASASPVFQSMLESGMLESVEGKVRLNEAMETVEALVEFMYTGQLTEMEDFADILRLADKYGVAELFDFIIPMIVKRVSPTSIVASLRALRPFLDRRKPAEAFKSLLGLVKGSSEMTEALAMAI